LIARTGAVGRGDVGRHKTVDRQPIIGPKNAFIKKLSTGWAKTHVSGCKLAAYSLKGFQVTENFEIIMGFPD
jgi:hypothetical protein